MPLTSKEVDALKARHKRYSLSDGEGLNVFVSPAGKKSWYYVYRSPLDNKPRQIKIGNYPNIKLKAARDKRKELAARVAMGVDPVIEKQKRKVSYVAAPTVQQLSEEYILKHAKPNKKSWKADQRTLNADVLPVMGKRKAKDVTRREVVLLLEKIATRAPVMSNRVLALLRKMFNFAVQRGILEHTPCSNIPRMYKEKPKDRVLNGEEIKILWSKLDTLNIRTATRNTLKLILVTAQRPGEVCGMRWEEISGQWWTIPEDRAKNGKPHRVFLSSIALELMGTPRVKGFILDGVKEGSPVSIFTINTALTKNADDIGIDKFTPHDLRRTAASGMAALGHGIIVDKILNHVDRRVTAIYDRYSYDNEKQQAMEGWGRKLQNILSGQQGNVVSLINARKRI